MPTILPYAVGQQAVFTFSKAWVCPPDVTSVIATGFGGGGSGAGCATTSQGVGQGGGGGALMSSISIAVVPGTPYLITIGAGGAAVAVGVTGNPGADTTFSFNGTVTGTWSGASGGQFISGGAGGGQPHKATGGGNLYTGNGTVASYTIAAGAYSAASATIGNTGWRNVVGGFDGGAGGALSTEGGGSGGGAGPEGTGAAGGAGSSGTGSNGSSAGANTGAGGGGGGAGGTTGGGGGAGGSGKLYLNYVSKYASIIQTTPPISNGLVLLLNSVLGVSFGTNGVASWIDQSGTADINKNCLQATAANQPSYNPNNSSFNGKPSIDFNGTTGYLVSGTWSSALAQPFTSLAVGVSNSSATTAILIDNLAAHQTSMEDATGTYEIFAGSATLNDSSGLVMTNPFAIGATFNGASSQLWAKQKTAQAIGTNPGANNMTGTTIGGLGSAPGNTTNSWNGSIAFIAIYNRTLSAAEMSAMMDWLGTTYNITIGA